MDPNRLLTYQELLAINLELMESNQTLIQQFNNAYTANQSLLSINNQLVEMIESLMRRP